MYICIYIYINVLCYIVLYHIMIISGFTVGVDASGRNQCYGFLWYSFPCLFIIYVVFSFTRSLSFVILLHFSSRLLLSLLYILLSYYYTIYCYTLSLLLLLYFIIIAILYYCVIYCYLYDLYMHSSTLLFPLRYT